MERAAFAGIVAAGLVGLIPVEVAALVIAAAALVLSISANAGLHALRRSLSNETARQTEVTSGVVSSARVVDSKLRDDDA